MEASDGQRSDVTALLREWRQGDSAALDQLTPLIYGELRRLAANFLRRERSGHTLQPTALVHEAYLRLAETKQPDWQDRAHFIGIAAHVMRQILMEHARGKNAQKRGGGQGRLSLDEGLIVSSDGSAELEALDDALKDLARRDERLAKLIELRYFGGLTGEEMAQVTGVSTATIARDIRFAHAWLQKYILGRAAPEET